jgi:hypothetical protein
MGVKQMKNKSCGLNRMDIRREAKFKEEEEEEGEGE